MFSILSTKLDVMSILSIFKALADETRLRLVWILASYELSVNELVSLLDMGQSRISRHLKILADSGLLTFRRDGLWVFYSMPENTSANSLWHGLEPFVQADSELAGILKSDVAMAASIVEERAIKSRQFFNSIAEDWDEINREIFGDFDLDAHILKLVPKCGVAVDLGCGTGHMLDFLLSKAQNVIGVDGSPGMLELARRRFTDSKGQVSLRIGELDHLPLADNEADFICVSMVLHHLEKPQIVLKEILRVLKPGGSLVIADFARHNNEAMRSKYGDRWLGFEEEFFKQSLNGFSIKTTERHKLGNGLEILIISAVR